MTDILAPLPDLSMIHDLIEAGADRLYTGIRNLSREGIRTAPDSDELAAFAKNHPGLAEKVHLALNIVPGPGKIEEIMITLEDLIARGYSQFILNEHGLLRMIAKQFPQTKLSGSVGLCTVNAMDALFLEEIGAHAMVLPIFSSPADLKEIKHLTSLQVEVFVICRGEPVLQGKCMLTGYLLTRESPREKAGTISSKKTGLCYTVCRTILGAYPDHDITERIREWTEAGADIFKIEGRYRKLDEITGMVKRVRKALNRAGQ